MATLREKCAQHWPAIKAIGLSGQMHGAVLLDAEGQAIRPAILWNDTSLRRRVRRAGGDGAGAASGGGKPGDAGLYRAEAVVGAPSASRSTFSAPPRCCCPRIICATG